ncbi:MAG TPA: expansin EXLX1 family cellulose-binding protein [Actinoplanes sp.]|nr:expansin EXLX1 family cellulose-binding protein [Actinoplanes sp.]
MTLLTPRLLATGGAVVLAGVVGVALLLQHGGSACAAPPPTAAKRGEATFYDLGSGTGNCSFPSRPANDLFVALGGSEYSGSAACGSYLDVTGPKGGVRVKVIDSCPPCEPGHIDLSRTAFKKIADELDGIVPVTYRRVANPAVPGSISVRLKEGSSRYWFAVLIDNHANPLTGVKVSSRGGSARPATRADYNYWIIEGGAGPGPFTITVSDSYGKRTTLSGIKLSPGVTQRTASRAAAPSPASPSPVSPSPSMRKPSAPPSAALLESTSAPGTEPPSEPSVALAAAPAKPTCG